MNEATRMVLLAGIASAMHQDESDQVRELLDVDKIEEHFTAYVNKVQKGKTQEESDKECIEQILEDVRNIFPEFLKKS
jgi:hypothetical protein